MFLFGFGHLVEISVCEHEELERLGRVAEQPATTGAALRRVIPPLSGEVRVLANVDATGAPWFPRLASSTVGSDALAACVVATFDDVRFSPGDVESPQTVTVHFGAGVHVAPTADEQMRLARELFPTVEPCLADRRAAIEGAVLVTSWRLSSLAEEFDECLDPVVRAEDVALVRVAALQGALSRAEDDYWGRWDDTADRPRDAATIRELATLAATAKMARATLDGDAAAFSAASAFLEATRETVRTFHDDVIELSCRSRSAYVGTNEAMRTAWLEDCRRGIVPEAFDAEEE